MADIVHFGKYYFPNSGGIERVTVSLARGAAINGHNVAVVCFSKAKSKVVEVIDKVQVIRTPINFFLASQPIGVKYFLNCLNYSKRASIVHLHAPNMLAALCVLFIPAKTRLLVHWHSDVVNKGLLGKFLRPLEYLMLRRSNVVISTSPAYAEMSESLKPFLKKITVVPLGISDIKYRHTNFKLPPQLEYRIENKKIVLSVGRLVSYKGFETLVEAAQHLSDKSVVVIVGEGPMEKILKQKIIDFHLENRVILTGKIDDAELHQLLSIASIYCLTSNSKAEAFGVVLLEAMCYGLPIVATKINGSGVNWVNIDGVTGLSISIGEPKAIAEACNKILTSECLHTRLSLGARNRFITEFTEEASIKKMIAVYNSLLCDN
jgi:glycosyltransferase involved in cell wall biosynthesis